MTYATPAYACTERAAGNKQCDRWCGDSSKCIASDVLVSARANIERRYTSQGAAAARDDSCPYRPTSAAATWWQRGYETTHGVKGEGHQKETPADTHEQAPGPGRA